MQVILSKFSIFALLLLCGLSYSYADISKNGEQGAIFPKGYVRANESDPMGKFFPSSFVGSIFSKKLGVVRELKEEKPEGKNGAKVEESKAPVHNTLEFQTSEISKKTFLPPDQTPQVAINPEAPSSVISMIESNRRGDKVTAKSYAKQFVRMLQNYFFEVREITELIGDALIEENAIKEDDWVGASQGIDIELAKTRLEKGIPIKPTHDVAMTRIVPDPKKEVEIYFLFTRSCSYCRLMAPDVERIYQVVKGDERVKLTGLVVGAGDEIWLKEFRAYTGVTFPVFDGTDLAKSLNLKYMPVILVVSPNGQKSYFKSGQQTFDRMYEFVRVAQGLPVEDSSILQSIIKTPIGEGERLIAASVQERSPIYVSRYNSAAPMKVSFPKKLEAKIQVDKF